MQIESSSPGMSTGDAERFQIFLPTTNPQMCFTSPGAEPHLGSCWAVLWVFQGSVVWMFSGSVVQLF